MINTLCNVIQLVINVCLVIRLFYLQKDYDDVYNSLKGFRSLMEQGRLYQRGWKSWDKKFDTNMFDKQIFNDFNNEIISQTWERCKRYPDKPNVEIACYIPESMAINLLHSIKQLENENTFLRNYDEAIKKYGNYEDKDKTGTNALN